MSPNTRAGKVTNLPAAGRDYNIILDVLCFFVFKPICVHLCLPRRSDDRTGVNPPKADKSVAELLQYYRLSTCPSNYKNRMQKRGFSKVSIYNEAKQENGLYTFLFYRRSYMGMRNYAKKTFNRGFVEVV
ncbi:MAG: hypothetical protein ACNYWU_02570 [Desulfobacterales bacterium]